MRRIAHLSDVHLLDPNTKRSTARYRVATRAVSLGRPIDPRGRAQKLARALAAAKASHADHVVISGDLTELGEPIEFEHFADVLDAANLPEDSVTLVPGNHDAYTVDGAWKRALAGPLARWAGSSAEEPGKIVDRGNVAFLPIDSTCFQSIARSGGVFSRDAARAVESRITDPGLRDKSLLIVIHHPPFSKPANPLWQWIDALRGSAQVLDMLAKNPRVQILHGHMHKVVDRIVAAKTRIFGAPAIVDDAATTRVRIYDLHDGAIASAGIFAM